MDKRSELQQMKRAGRKIVGVVCWDYPMARMADRAGVDLISVGDSVGANLWGQEPDEITLDELLVVCRAVRRGVKRAVLSYDLPVNDQSVEAALRMKEAGADMVKTMANVEAMVRAGVAVFAEMHGGNAAVEVLVAKARSLEDAGATLIDFRHSGPAAGEAVARAVKIPVIGGLGGGPWLDGRMRMALAAVGYLESPTEQYANVAKTAFDALTAYSEDVRAGRQIRGQRA